MKLIYWHGNLNADARPQNFFIPGLFNSLIYHAAEVVIVFDGIRELILQKRSDALVLETRSDALILQTRSAELLPDKDR